MPGLLAVTPRVVKDGPSLLVRLPSLSFDMAWKQYVLAAVRPVEPDGMRVIEWEVVSSLAREVSDP